MSTPNSTLGAYDFKTTQRHEQYYISTGDVVFMVENVFFRVHRYFFERESIFFKDKFTGPASPGKEQAGTSDSNAILIQDIRKKERAKGYSDITVKQFETFLWVFYNPRYSLYETSLEHWTWILDLADRWNFTQVKDLAVRELEKITIPIVDRIALYQDFNVDTKHLMPYYVEMCSRDQEIDIAIGERIGWKVALRLQNARERALRTEFGGRTPAPGDVNSAEMGTIIQGSLLGSPPPTPATNPFNALSPLETGASQKLFGHGALANGGASPANEKATEGNEGKASPASGKWSEPGDTSLSFANGNFTGPAGRSPASASGDGFKAFHSSTEPETNPGGTWGTTGTWKKKGSKGNPKT